MSCKGRLARGWWAFALVASLWAGPLGPGGLTHLGEGDDPACAVPAPPDGTPRTIETADARGLPLDQHCATCHWLCSLRWQSPPSIDIRFGVSAAGSLPPDISLPEPPARVIRLAARAPPAARSIPDSFV
jgi:hypothetical protein